MRYYYITISWDNINSVFHSRIIPMVAATVDEAIEKAIAKVANESGKFNVTAKAYHIVS